jgi:hypothetical protein
MGRFKGVVGESEESGGEKEVLSSFSPFLSEYWFPLSLFLSLHSLFSPVSCSGMPI